jgi:hypothetical protein
VALEAPGSLTSPRRSAPQLVAEVALSQQGAIKPTPEALAEPDQVIARPVVIMATSCTGTMEKMILWHSLNI